MMMKFKRGDICFTLSNIFQNVFNEKYIFLYISIKFSTIQTPSTSKITIQTRSMAKLAPRGNAEKMPVNIEAALQSAEKNDNKKISCDTCGRLYSKRSNLNAHIRSVHNLAKWECPDCQEIFSTKTSLKRHIFRKHPKLVKRDKKSSQAGSLKVNLNEQEYFGMYELSDGAKLAKIRRLEKEVEGKNTKIKILEDLNAALRKHVNELREQNKNLNAKH